MPKFTGRAIVQAVSTLDSAGLPVEPARVALHLQELLSALVSQGYEVLGVQPMPGAMLCTAIKRDPAPPHGIGRQRFYGCEGFTCRPGAHTLDCPNIDKPEVP